MAVTREALTSADVRARVGHPIVDFDGHWIEYHPVLEQYLRDAGIDPSRVVRQPWLPGLDPVRDPVPGGTPSAAAERERRAMAAWWLMPTMSALDVATSALPALYRARLDEFGIDFSLVLPSHAPEFIHQDDEDLRLPACRAANQFAVDVFTGCRDRLEPVAMIPMHTPAEAIAELEHAVRVQGFKVVCMPSFVRRPVPAVAERAPELGRHAPWRDTFGVDSAFDYDPVWRQCDELGVSPMFHSGSIGTGGRVSVSNYVFNHIGNLAAGGEAVCKSLFLGGVTHRFPRLRFAFLEGGVAWASSLYNDVVGHWSKRNRERIGDYDPQRVDRAAFFALMREHGTGPIAAMLAQCPDAGVGELAPSSAGAHDDFAASGVERAEDIRDIFTSRFFFGCEADDRSNALAFQERLHPFGARLRAAFGSDISHWDAPDPAAVVREAWELVEDGLLDEADFRAFTCTNAVEFCVAGNPGFFAGTVLESDPVVAAALATTQPVA